MSSVPNLDPAAFHVFEHAGWQGAAQQYDDAFGSLTRQTIAPLLDAAGVRSGTRVLDVASGPGYVAAAAAERGARVTGLDFSAAMLKLARRHNPGIRFRKGDAAALPCKDGSLDAVLMNFGMLHLAQPERAVAEALRVLRPGGTYAFTVWAKPEEALGFGIVIDAVRNHGNPEVGLPPGPPFFRFADGQECENLLKVAGFGRVSVNRVTQVWRFSDPAMLFQAFLEGSVRTRALLQAQVPQALAAIREAIGKAAAGFQDHGTVQIPMPAVLAVAQRPGP